MSLATGLCLGILGFLGKLGIEARNSGLHNAHLVAALPKSLWWQLAAADKAATMLYIMITPAAYAGLP